MNNLRHLVLDWAERGHLAAAELPRALALAEVLPSRPAAAGDGRGTCRLGGDLFSRGQLEELGCLARFELAQALLAAALLIVWRLGLDRPGGKAALFAACMLVGALLALIGQT